MFACRSAADARLLSNILAATAHELAVDAIVSIIFSPGTSKPFGALATSLKVPSCLIYGREDPWVMPYYAAFQHAECIILMAVSNIAILICRPLALQVKPVWGQRLRRLLQGSQTAYFEISPAGHCPHDESPEAVSYCMRDWIASIEDSRKPSLAVGAELTMMSKVNRAVLSSGSDCLGQLSYNDIAHRHHSAPEQDLFGWLL